MAVTQHPLKLPEKEEKEKEGLYLLWLVSKTDHMWQDIAVLAEY